jgi:hypothetical protein
MANDAFSTDTTDLLELKPNICGIGKSTPSILWVGQQAGALDAPLVECGNAVLW